MEQRAAAHPSLQLSVRPDTLCFPCGTIAYWSMLSSSCHFPKWYGPSRLFTNGMILLRAIVLTAIPLLRISVVQSLRLPYCHCGSARGKSVGLFSGFSTWYSPGDRILFMYYYLYANQPNLHVPCGLLPSLYGLVQELTIFPNLVYSIPP